MHTARGVMILTVKLLCMSGLGVRLRFCGVCALVGDVGMCMFFFLHTWALCGDGCTWEGASLCVARCLFLMYMLAIG